LEYQHFLRQSSAVLFEADPIRRSWNIVCPVTQDNTSIVYGLTQEKKKRGVKQRL
jgi:hypothetical protein